MKLSTLSVILISTVFLLSGCIEQSEEVTLSPPPKKIDVVTKPVPSISTTGEIINGIPVPPEPDPVENNATLAGVDSNKNGVRDDVEHFLATKSSTTKEMSRNIAIASSMEKILVAKTLSADQEREIFRAIRCAEKIPATLSTNDIERAVLNNKQREIAYYETIIKGKSGFLLASELGPCE